MKNANQFKNGLIILCLSLVYLLNTIQAHGQASTVPMIIYHDEFIRGENPAPLETIKADNTQHITISGHYSKPQVIEEEWPAIALQASNSWIEITFNKPSTAIGVQFWGDANDGQARIIVDGTEVGKVDTNGINITYERYVQISNLPDTSHTLRIEPAGHALCGCNNTHVTVRAFGWGEIPGASTDKGENSAASFEDEILGMSFDEDEMLAANSMEDERQDVDVDINEDEVEMAHFDQDEISEQVISEPESALIDGKIQIFIPIFRL